MYANSFNTVCDNNVTFIYLISNSGYLFIYNKNWNYLKKAYITCVSSPNYIISYTKDKNLFLIISFYYGIYSLDANLNLINSYLNYSNYKKMYFNISSDLLFACSSIYKTIDIFNHQLTYNKSISTSPFLPTDIDSFNDVLFISTNSRIIFMVQNEKIINNFNTSCTSITSLVIDPYGNIAVLCSSNVIQVYSSTGIFSGISWKFILPYSVIDFSFDLNSNLVFFTSSSIILMNNQTRTINSSGISTERACISNSKKLFLM